MPAADFRQRHQPRSSRRLELNPVTRSLGSPARMFEADAQQVFAS
jgi:hypothetical protein